ncbi:MAG: methylhydantoinase [Actinomycetota bacterium]|nr:methylhydantoinase [Actinomycetota bacterium]
MAVRVGVDVGGTFTKAVACDASSGEVVARSVVPTTHADEVGVAAGVVRAVRDVSEAVTRSDRGPVLVVSHSTTQAVNALLEGDTAKVGILGIGRRPDLRRSRKRTQVGKVRLAPGHELETLHEFVDVSDGLRREDIADAFDRLSRAGASAFCVSEAFGVEDPQGERLALEIATEKRLPVCAGHELSGLYGLEMRTVTGALNASILPTALATARVVEDAIERSTSPVPLLVMRGDGGAADLRSMRRHPILTAFSGPAASVSGALRHLAIGDGVVVEVGGTSTNVSSVKGGRPVLAYVRVLDHVTCIRSLDVRVVGVAGGSLMRLARRRARLRVEDVGPRSAHIAGLEYSCFASRGDLEGARLELISPRPGDPAHYAVLRTKSGRLLAPTLTCAANALGDVPDDVYASGDVEAARAAFEIVGAALGSDWRSAAEVIVSIAAQKVGAIVTEAAAEQELVDPLIVGLGGGAGALLPRLGVTTGLEWRIPQDAEVISSIGDALSLVRVEVEGTISRKPAEAVADLHRRAEQAAVGAGAAPSSLQVEGEPVPERGALRVVATGSVALESGAVLDDDTADEETMQLVAKRALGEEATRLWANDFYSIYVGSSNGRHRYAVVDRKGSLATSGKGHVELARGAEMRGRLETLVEDATRHLGPVAVAPGVRLVRGARLIDLTLFSEPKTVIAAAEVECALAGDEEMVAFVGRS